MVIELVLNFKDEYSENPSGTSEFSYTLNAPEGFEVTGGQIFVEHAETSDLQRFSFRIDRDDDGKATLNVMEAPE